MKAGTWPSIVLVYLFGVLASASLSKIIPLLADLGLHLGATPVQFGLLISMMTIPAALFAAAAGSLIDRIGARTALRLAAGIGVIANFSYLQASSLHAFMAIRVFEGLLTVGIFSAAPALIMATASDARRGRAMAFWSTYTPVGISLGLALSAQFAGTDNWRGGYLIHMSLFAGLLLASGFLPRSPRVLLPAGASRPGLLSVLTQPGPLRLSLTFAMLVLVGFGMSTVFPDWFAAQHQVPVGEAANILAVANLAMIPGGLIAGWLLARNYSSVSVLATLMLLTVGISLPLFIPGLGELPRIVAVFAWTLAQGAAIAVITSALPRVISNPMQGAAAAGLLSQFAAMTTFVTPLIWRPILASGTWLLFVAVVGCGALAAFLLFPGRAEQRS